MNQYIAFGTNGRNKRYITRRTKRNTEWNEREKGIKKKKCIYRVCSLLVLNWLANSRYRTRTLGNTDEPFIG